MKMVALTDAEKMRIMEISNSGLSKILFGMGTVLKGAAWATRTSTELAAKGLRTAADGVETVGDYSATKMESGSAACLEKSEEYRANAELLKKAAGETEATEEPA